MNGWDKLISTFSISYYVSEIFWVGEGQRRLKNRYSIKRRRYIGNSTMDPEMAFIQANLVQAADSRLALDPFCGTGMMLISPLIIFQLI